MAVTSHDPAQHQPGVGVHRCRGSVGDVLAPLQGDAASRAAGGQEPGDAGDQLRTTVASTELTTDDLGLVVVGERARGRHRRPRDPGGGAVGRPVRGGPSGSGHRHPEVPRTRAVVDNEEGELVDRVRHHRSRQVRVVGHDGGRGPRRVGRLAHIGRASDTGDSTSPAKVTLPVERVAVKTLPRFAPASSQRSRVKLDPMLEPDSGGVGNEPPPVHARRLPLHLTALPSRSVHLQVRGARPRADGQVGSGDSGGVHGGGGGGAADLHVGREGHLAGGATDSNTRMAAPPASTRRSRKRLEPAFPPDSAPEPV